MQNNVAVELFISMVPRSPCGGGKTKASLAFLHNSRLHTLNVMILNRIIFDQIESNSFNLDWYRINQFDIEIDGIYSIFMGDLILSNWISNLFDSINLKFQTSKHQWHFKL